MNIWKKVCIHRFSVQLVSRGSPVYRVNWLRSKARRDRWQEELILLRLEMEWTRNYYLHQVGLWRNIAVNSEAEGPQCFALAKVEMWEQLHSHATIVFSSLPVP